MRTIAPVSWAEGMFLKPHHLQQADLFQDARLAYHLRVLNGYHWGVAKLRIDVDALENMMFRVVTCEAVLPDGLVVRAPDDAVVEERSFQDEFPPAAAALDVYLTVKALAGDAAGADRYVRESETRRDLLMRDNDAPIEFLVPRAQLLFAAGPADERLAGLQWLKIAQVRRTGRQVPRFELVPGFVPAALCLQASPGLARAVTDVLERLVAASTTFGQFRRARGPDALGYGVGDLEQLLARVTINQYAPALMHALLNDGIHPYAAYGLLAGLRGALTSYFPDEDVSAFPPYEHTDLGGCFAQLGDEVRRLLERLLPQHYVELPLERTQDIFATPIEESLFGRTSVWVLGLHGIGEEAVRRRMNDAKVTSTQDMPQLVNYASNGVPVRYLVQPPAQIPRYAGWTYFEVDAGDSRWKRIKEDASFALHLVNAEPSLEGRLFAVLSERERAKR
jgi:type VI secretion system protein ImpJ